MRWANLLHVYQPPGWSPAVITRVVKESYRPLFSFLRAHPGIRLTLNISGSLTEQLARSRHRSVLLGIRELVARQHIELTGSAMYHAILPLLPKREIIRQIRLNDRTNRRWFGAAYRPSGFFPPEMAYNQKLGRVLHTLGYRWIVLDSISHPNFVNYERAYHIRGTGLSAVFRNRYLSDYLAFSAHTTDIPQFPSIVRRWNGQTNVLITALDGENLGHHRPAAKDVWQRLVQRRDIETVTLSELLASLHDHTTIVPRPASWSSTGRELRRGVPFGLWRNPENDLHRLQWQLLAIVQRLVNQREQSGWKSSATRRAFDQALSSDWFWWASREPWWDVDIVVRAAQKFVAVATSLHPSAKILKRVQALAEKIEKTGRAWHQSGVAQRHARLFLEQQHSPRYLGGERVD